MTSPQEQIYCVLDYETFSEAPLKKCGSYEYSRHESTEILCAAWTIGTKEQLLLGTPIRVFTPFGGGDVAGFVELKKALLNPSHTLVAHNALFEQAVTRRFGRNIGNHELSVISPERWMCTASMAAALALPRSLEGAAKALRLSVQKDMEGNRLIQRWCKPRKPTIKNPKSRWDDPAEYQRLVEYCINDVATEVALFLKVPFLTEKERKVWLLDQTINLRGFAVDRPLVETILQMIAEETEELNREVAELSMWGLSSANQRAGVLSWLESEGVFLPDLRKKTVEDAIKDGLVSGDTKRMLEIRLAISKTSTAKYQAFEIRSRFDGRLRDILMYHTASTGRWGGAGVQPQNFPRGDIKNTVKAAEVLAGGDLELVRMIYGDPMSVFSSCLRGMIIAPPGKTLDVADYASIEVRVLFWLANHLEGTEAFEKGRDLYVELASKIFGIKRHKVDASQRFVGKTAVLGCFSAETAVLTNSGWKPILNINAHDQLWDGEDWVYSEGVVCQGEKETIDLAGISVTPEHPILIHKTWASASEIVENRTLRLALDTGFSGLKGMKSGHAAVFAKSGFLVPAIEDRITKFWQLMSSRALRHVVINVAKKQPTKRIILNISGSTKRKCRIRATGRVYSIGSPLPSLGAIRPQPVVSTTMAGGGYPFLKTGEMTERRFLRTLKHFRDGTTRRLKWTELITTEVTNRAIYGSALLPKMQRINERPRFSLPESLNSKKKCITYDIANCGPRNRFTVLSADGPLIVHNCGYAMGDKKFAASCLALGQEVSEDLAKAAVTAYRTTHQPVVSLWSKIGKAAIAAVENLGKKYSVNHTSWYVRDGFLFCKLPSGRRLSYPEPRVEYELTPWGEKRPVLYHWGVDPLSRKWTEAKTYGGKLVENVVQAIARDLMAEAMLRIEADGRWEIVLSVHDELVAERSKETPLGSGLEFNRLMAEVPLWAKGCPIKVEGWSGERYRK